LKKVIVYGSGQVGVMVAYILSYHKDVQVIGFVDDDPDQKGKLYNQTPVLGDRSIISRLQKEGVSSAVVTIGNNQMRGEIAANLQESGFELMNAIHPSATISKHVKIGAGNIIGANVTLYVNAEIGDNVFIGPSVTVSHDTVVGNNVLLSVGSVIGARVDIEDYAFVGSGATVMPTGWGQDARLRLGRNCLVGVGAVVIKDVPENAVVVGMPAEVLRYQDQVD
jgi:UDP-perosamine 4-acetyltransferase